MPHLPMYHLASGLNGTGMINLCVNLSNLFVLTIQKLYDSLIHTLKVKSTISCTYSSMLWHLHDREHGYTATRSPPGQLPAPPPY